MQFHLTIKINRDSYLISQNYKIFHWHFTCASRTLSRHLQWMMIIFCFKFYLLFYVFLQKKRIIIHFCVCCRLCMLFNLCSDPGLISRTDQAHSEFTIIYGFIFVVCVSLFYCLRTIGYEICCFRCCLLWAQHSEC